MTEIENLIAEKSKKEFNQLDIKTQMRLLRGETVKDSKGNLLKLGMCLEGLHYKQDGTVEIIEGR